MIQCITCGADVAFFQGDEHRRCNSCVKAGRWPVDHPKYRALKETEGKIHADQSIDVPTNNESVGSGTAVFVTAVAWATLGISLLAAIIFWVQAGDVCSYYCDQYERIEKRDLVVMGWSSAIGGMLTSTLFFALGKITKHLSEIADSLKSE